MEWLLRGLGMVVFVFGLVLTGRVAWLQRTFKPHGWRATGWAGSVLLGVTFGLGWTPCIGPTLAAVLTLASDQADASRGALLATSYALGLGLPFVALAAGFAWAARSSAWLRRHLRALNLLGGVMLMALGVLLITGVWQTLNSWLISEVVGYFQLGI